MLLEKQPKFDNNTDPGFSGRSELVEAANKGYTEFAALLIEYGADVNLVIPREWVPDGFGRWRTPLARAAGQDHMSTVQLLIEKGA